MLRNALEPWHLVLVILVFAVLFGHKRLPDAARGVGRSLRILKAETRALNDREHEPDRRQEPDSDPSRRPQQR
ncbi:Sec-independent protein translocase subunit TatA [Streptomyces sp. TRM70350]|uniref:Sec-independent protein translocase subunit TatA n=1 Tax=Streptomyces sp. TRM70350 TaxID=2856165 RepID=UPI001C4705C3|nr:Sec-independent protein translocase subunit TatA [Streptomyces sp. TRM70350]MBV7699430.1 Sec-independent protein translocase subunit TatA [Streptomyces sp. TRM70350]